MYVVFDSNIWISELGLKSTLGAAVRFYLKCNKAILAIPEVIKLESEHNLRNRLNEYISSIQKNHSNLLSIFGKLKEVVLPKKEDIDEIINGLFSNLDVEFIEIPFSIESAKSSFYKTIDKRPPSDKSQQFKDGVIWADCVSLLCEGDVHLVTEDKAFYENRQYSNGLVSNLKNEIAECDNKLFIYSSLHDLIKSIQSDVAILPEDLLKSFLEKYEESVNRTLERVGFEICNIEDSVISSFATESPSLLYIEFELLINCNAVIDDGRTNGKLLLKGDGQLDLDAGTYSELRNFGEEFLYTAPDGTEEKTKNTVLFIDSAVIGHKEVKHSVRYKLD
jgi:hypothetical protein